jgi:hypothetical protein
VGEEKTIPRDGDELAATVDEDGVSARWGRAGTLNEANSEVGVEGPLLSLLRVESRESVPGGGRFMDVGGPRGGWTMGMTFAGASGVAILWYSRVAVVGSAGVRSSDVRPGR